MSMSVLWSMLVVGCRTEIVRDYQTVTQQDLNQLEEDTAYLAELEAVESPSIEEIESILQQGIEQIRTVRVGRLLDVYDAMLGQTDSDCPRWFNNPDGLYWADSCTSDQGVSFEGFATSIPRNDTEPDPYGNIFVGRQIHCEGTLSDGETQMSCVGGINELTGVDANGHDVFYSYSRPYVLTESGTTSYFPDAEMWAVNAPTYKAIFYNGVQLVREDDDQAGQEDQGEQGADGVIGAVEFGEQTFSNVDCLMEPNGTQHIQVNGQWIYVEWHGDQLTRPERCDGCGEAYAQGQPIGQVCADFSNWLSWTASPFE